MSEMNRLKLASLALAGLSAVASGSALAASMTVDSNGGLEVFELGEDRGYWFKIGGRLHIDTVIYEGGEAERSKFPSGSHIRRARVTMKGGVGNNWVYKLDIDHFDLATRTSSNAGDAVFGEAFLAYNGCKNIWFAIGQVGVPYSLEGWGSSNVTTFMEGAHPIESFAPNLGIGAYAEWHGEMVTLAGAIVHPRAGTRQFGDVLSTQPSANPAAVAALGAAQNGAGPAGSDPGSDPIMVGGRMTFSPVHDDHTVYHAGVSYRYQNVHDSANRVNFGGGLEIRNRQSPSIFTNIPPNSVQNYQVWGGELAGRWGPFMLSGEFVHTTVEREGQYPLLDDPRNPGDDLTYYGYYVTASYVLTGEAKEYDFVSGTFGRVHPRSHKGAWEVAARHSYVKLLDIREFNNLPIPWALPNFAAPGHAFPPAGGIATANLPAQDVNDIVGNTHSTTVGVTWWVNDNVRLMANYARMNFASTGPLHPFQSSDTDINAVGFRAQVNW